MDEHLLETFSQIDPNGLDQHAVGAKLDANKPHPAIVMGGFATALQQVTLVGTFGAQKYSIGSWKQVPNGYQRYQDAMMRHWLKHQSGEEFDDESGLNHLAHIAWNSLAILELYFEQTQRDLDCQ